MLFLDVLDAYVVSFEGWLILTDEEGMLRFDALEALAGDLFAMVSVNYHSMRPLDRREFTQYMVALLHAVQMRIPDPGEGPHIFYRFETLDPEYRAQVQEELGDFDRPLTEVTPSRWAEKKHGHGGA